MSQRPDIAVTGSSSTQLLIASRNETGVASSLLSRKIRTSFVRARSAIEDAATSAGNNSPPKATRSELEQPQSKQSLSRGPSSAPDLPVIEHEEFPINIGM